MANLTETGVYPAGITQLEVTHKAQGGAGGDMNIQATELANRTAYLKNFADQFVSASVAIDADTTLTDPVELIGDGAYVIAAGVTLTINGPFRAPLKQVFSGAGAVAFGAGAVNEVYPQWWGAKADGSTDDSAAIAGALAAVVTGGTVKSPAGTYVVAMNAMSFGGKSVSLIGDNATFSLVAGTGTSVFDMTDSDTVLVKGIKFTTAAALATVFADCLTGYTETFVVTDCEFIGPVRLIYNTGSTTQDPTVTPFGFGTFRYERNNALNMDVTHIKIIDTPIEKGIFRNNDIHNFSFVYLNNSVTNGSANNTALMEQGNFVISDNTVVNDDDYYCAAGAGDYYAFVLIENNTVAYERNHVEGMKIDVAGWTCYDAYLSSVNVINADNLFKNSANLNAAAINNTLIKCKRDSVAGMPVAKRIIGNAYIMESDWVARIGKTAADVRHSLYGLGVTNSGVVVIANNTFDLQMLDYSGQHPIEDICFSGNTIRAVGLSINAGATGYVAEFSPFSATSKCEIVDNRVTVAGASLFDFYFARQNGGIWESLKVIDNVVDVDVDPSKAAMALYGQVASSAVVRNNTFKMPSRYEAFNCILKNAQASNNLIYGNNTNKIRTMGFLNVYGSSCVTALLSGAMESISHYPLKSSTYVPGASTKYTVSVSFNTATGANRVDFSYELQYAAGVYTVVWTDAADNVRNDVIGTADGNAITAKTVLVGSGSLSLAVKFYNSASLTYFAVTGFPTGKCDYSYEIRSFEA